MNQRVLTFPTEEAGGDFVQRDAILVAHSAGGSERIIHKGEVVEEEVRGSFGVKDGLGDSIEGGRGGRGIHHARVLGEEGFDFVVKMGARLLTVGVVHDGFVGCRAGNRA